MRVLLRNPRRELEVDGPLSVGKLLRQLDLNRESVLVVRGDTLVPGDAVLADDDVIEIRPVISGGAPELRRRVATDLRALSHRPAGARTPDRMLTLDAA